MKHKKYLRKQVEGEDSENVSDEKEDDDVNPNLKYIKKEEDSTDKAVMDNDEMNNNLLAQRLNHDNAGIAQPTTGFHFQTPVMLKSRIQGDEFS